MSKKNKSNKKQPKKLKKVKVSKGTKSTKDKKTKLPKKEAIAPKKLPIKKGKLAQPTDNLDDDLEDLVIDKEDTYEEVEEPAVSSKLPEYEFKNYFTSETQLKSINHTDPPEDIIKAYTRLIWVKASNYARESVEIEDLIAEAQKGVCEAIKEWNDPTRKRPNYNFQQTCLYKINSSIYQYCLRNAVQIKTPYYIQRGCMHVAQIFKIMNNQSVAEAILNRKGPATEDEIIKFIYDEDERLPKKPIKFIKAQITKSPNSPEFEQILAGIMKHEVGSRHSYVKKNLTSAGKILHIKEKLYYTSSSNNMNYARVIDLILSARQSKVELNPAIYSPQHNNVEKHMDQVELIEKGKQVCGDQEFNIFVQNKFYDKNYDEIAEATGLKKSIIIDIIKKCIRLLRRDEFFQDKFNSM